MKIEDKVPKTTPTVIAKEKLKIADPPKVTKVTKEIKVVIEVISVLENVALIAEFTRATDDREESFFRSSRIRSKTMMVSFNE